MYTAKEGMAMQDIYVYKEKTESIKHMIKELGVSL